MYEGCNGEVERDAFDDLDVSFGEPFDERPEAEREYECSSAVDHQKEEAKGEATSVLPDEGSGLAPRGAPLYFLVLFFVVHRMFHVVGKVAVRIVAICTTIFLCVGSGKIIL